jgi:hypothetical protein
MGWLFEECAVRGLQTQDLARELCVTTGYLMQMRSGIRQTANISRDFAANCAVFLNVPTVVVLIIAGHLKLIDFVCATDLERWLESAADHAEVEPVQLRCGTAVGPHELCLLPYIVEALQGAASIHEMRARVS